MLPITADSPDLSIIIVSANDARWLDACLSTVFTHAGSATLDVVVVDNESTDGTRELVEANFPQARVITSINHGFAYGNNRGLETSNARYVLFLNPDTEVISGSFGDLIDYMDRRVDVGLLGVRQCRANGELHPTIRRFPTVTRALGEALMSERWPVTPAWAGERVLDSRAYEREYPCDWSSGSYMLVRREALSGAGLMDERFFIYAEEPDLCLRIKQAGWSVVHTPAMTIIHHANKAGIRPRMIAQDTYVRRQYSRKHFSRLYGLAYLSAIALRHLVRLLASGVDEEDGAARRQAAWLALRTLVGLSGPPFGAPPQTSVRVRDDKQGTYVG